MYTTVKYGRHIQHTRHLRTDHMVHTYNLLGLEGYNNQPIIHHQHLIFRKITNYKLLSLIYVWYGTYHHQHTYKLQLNYYMLCYANK